jgi:hypothetical protein
MKVVRKKGHLGKCNSIKQGPHRNLKAGPMIILIMAKEEGGDWIILNRCGKRMLVWMICSNNGMVVVMGKGSCAESEVEQLEV